MPSARSRFWCPTASPAAKSAHRSRRSEHRGAAVGRTDLSLGRQCKRIGSFGNITVKTDGLTVVVEVIRLDVTGRVVDELQAGPHLLATLASIHDVQPPAGAHFGELLALRGHEVADPRSSPTRGVTSQTSPRC